MAKAGNGRWPVLRVFERDHLRRVAMPLGGIGTGTVSLGGRGDLRDWELMNRPAKGFVPPGEGGVGPLFALWTKGTAAGRRGMRDCLEDPHSPRLRRASSASRVTQTRLIEGPIDEADYDGAYGADIRNHGLPRFRRCRFLAAYPLAQVELSDPDVPLAVRIEAFNPLVPCDAEASGIPVAVLRYVLVNRGACAVEAAVCGMAPNYIGADGSRPAGQGWSGRPVFGGLMKDNRNEFRRGKGLCGLYMYSEGVDRHADAWGTMALCAVGTAADEDRRKNGRGQDARDMQGRDALATGDVTYRTGWKEAGWGEPLRDFWEDFALDGRVDEREGREPAPKATLAVRLTVPPRAERAVTFLLAWHFPNRRTWTPAPAQRGCLEDSANHGAELTSSKGRRGLARKGKPRRPDAAATSCACGGQCQAAPDLIGNYYATRYRDAWEVAERTAADLPRLEERTVRFVRSVVQSDLPPVVADAALSNLTALRSQTSFRTADGVFYGWEGCHDHSGCCHGSCTHVWNYESATGLLFGELARSARRVEFEHATDERGLMSFRVHLPLARAREFGKAAADGQMGTIMRLYREWRLSGDEGLLGDLWPHARRAMEFCWIAGGWDGDRDGVMEGCQHNTMDVEYFGPNPEVGFWYLGALRAAEEMALAAGDADFATTCRSLFERGSKWMDGRLFNGEYYEHEIRPPASAADVAPGLSVGMGAKDLSEPDFQLGSGCLADQLVGQTTAHLLGLGRLCDGGHGRAALRAIMKHNFRESFAGHFNYLRSYVLGGESALLVASYPRGRLPKSPFPYASEAWTGLEYTAAVGMICEGMLARAEGLRREGERLLADGLRIIASARSRHDGRKRNPFDEPECGHHYARAMASWGAVPALAGFQYDGRSGEMAFAAPEGGRASTRWFWSTGDAWGTVRIRAGGGGRGARGRPAGGRRAKGGAGGARVELDVLGGRMKLRRVTITGVGSAEVSGNASGDLDRDLTRDLSRDSAGAAGAGGVVAAPKTIRVAVGAGGKA